MSKYRVFSGPYFLALRLNTERYGVIELQKKKKKKKNRDHVWLDPKLAAEISSSRMEHFEVIREK